MWDCEVCGTTRIARGLETCPHCGAPYPDTKESDDMAKSSKLGGASGWPDPDQAPEAGTDSSASTEQQEQSSKPSEQQSQQPAQTTDGPSQQDQTEPSSVSSTAGGTADYQAARENVNDNGPYDEWRKDDLRFEADARDLGVGRQATKDDLMRALREDDQTVLGRQ